MRHALSSGLGVALVGLAFAVGCSSSSSSAAVDASNGATPAPTGGGYCCPIEGPEVSFTCSGNQKGGGWAATPSDCSKDRYHTPWTDERGDVVIDEHGCKKWGNVRNCLGGFDASALDAADAADTVDVREAAAD